jgi:Mn2+/Fe2+ NRAMP family transporter
MKKTLKRLSKKLGPGIITGASDDEASGILTYLQTGVILGVSSLWLALVTLPLMYVIQEMCGRIGLVTDKGLIYLIKQHYSKFVLYFIALISVIVITINIGADLLAIGVVVEKLIGFSRLVWLSVTALLIALGTVLFSYRTLARVLKWLAFSLFFYVATALYIDLDWASALWSTVWPINFQWNTTSLMLVAAVVGTTISPYMFFWQAEEEVEERDSEVSRRGLKKFLVTKHELKDLKGDTFLGMLFSNVVMWFIVLTAAQLNNFYGLSSIENFDQAALVLRPLLGDMSFLMFSLGIIGTGLLAIPVLAGSVGYILAEVFGWSKGLNLPFRQAGSFYGAIIISMVIGVILSFTSLDPVKLLVYTAVFYAIITPILIFLIIRLANNKKIMGQRTNSLFTNILAYIALILISVLVIAYLISLFI